MNHLKKIIPFLMGLILCISCEKEISEIQSQYFVKFYGTYYNNYSSDMAKTDDGGYVIVGSSETEERGLDITFIRTDRYGRQEGEIIYYGTEFDDYGLSVEKLNDGYLIGGSVTDANGYKSAFILKVDSQGNQTGDIITYGEGNSINEEFNSIRLRTDNTYLAVGYRGNNSIIITYDPVGLSFNETFTGAGSTELMEIAILEDGRTLSAGVEGSDLYLVNIDENGNVYAQDKFGEEGLTNLFASFQPVTTSSYLLLYNNLVGGSYKMGLKRIDYEFTSPPPSSPVSITETDLSSGLPSSGNIEGKSVVQLSDGNFAVLATKSFAGDKNILLMILSPEGNLIGDPKEYGGSGNQEGVSLIPDGDRLLILGTNAFEGNSMITLIKTDNQGNIWE